MFQSFDQIIAFSAKLETLCADDRQVLLDCDAVTDGIDVTDGDDCAAYDAAIARWWDTVPLASLERLTAAGFFTEDPAVSSFGPLGATQTRGYAVDAWHAVQLWRRGLRPGVGEV
jgi:hypothetical protein